MTFSVVEETSNRIQKEYSTTNGHRPSGSDISHQSQQIVAFLNA